MTPAQHEATEIESEGAGTQQTNNRLVTSQGGEAVLLCEENVYFWPGDRRKMFQFFLFFPPPFFQFAGIRNPGIINHGQYFSSSSTPS